LAGTIPLLLESHLMIPQDRDSSQPPFYSVDARDFDLVIIGAGVAGASTASLASQRGMSVLLVESQTFPREKVCGGCLNQRAQEFLKTMGLLDPIRDVGALQIDRLHLQIDRYSLQWRMPSMLSVRRSTLDQILVDHAVHCGATFLDGTRAKIQPLDFQAPINHRVVVLKKTNAPAETVCVQSKMVIVASGLSRGSLPETEDWPAEVMNGSRVGLHTLVSRDCVPSALSTEWTNSTPQLHMLVGSVGYLGVCDTDGELVDLAAAIDPSAIRDSRSMSFPIRRVLDECGVDSSFVEGLDWQSTPHLTRRSECVAKGNIFLLGDATGYVEPFTGEGMSWAFKGAEVLVPLLHQAKNKLDARTAEKEWNSWITNHRNRRQRISRWVARQSRRPGNAKWMLRACDWMPPIRKQLLRSIMT
jgi:menaquinone-9 beta-reductase